MTNYWHMQIHPGVNTRDEAEEYAINALEHNYIGLDFDSNSNELKDRPLNYWSETNFDEIRDEHLKRDNRPGVTESLRDFAKEINMGDIVLVRAGAKPVGLVKVTAEYAFVQDDDDLWFRHRYPIKVLGMYDEFIKNHPKLEFTPPSQRTLQRLTNENRPTYIGISNWLEVILMDNKIRELRNLLSFNKQIVLQGPPGTGKTYTAKQLAISIINESTFSGEPTIEFKNVCQNNQAEIVQFHPSYNYEDFVRGIQVSTNDSGQPIYKTENRIFAEMADNAAAENNKKKKFVLIIDEINRANLSAVFGELIYALEYRGESVHTSYAADGEDHSLSVPNNLFIIGTMNTADRSIGNIDYAVRRRFAFVPCLPDAGVLSNFPKGKELFLLIQNLFDSKQGCLSPDFHQDDVQPGHTYFMAKDEELASKFSYQVYPLLREYYKDGILLLKDNSLSLSLNGANTIHIHRQMMVTEVYQIIHDWAV